MKNPALGEPQLPNLELVDRWDVSKRSRTSAFPWRGQFTPDLVSNLFDEFDPKVGLVLDPFMGSGTVIAEAINRERGIVGIELNPAAFILSRLFGLSRNSVSERKVSLESCKKEVASLLDKHNEDDPFKQYAKKIQKTQNEIHKVIASTVFLLAAKNSNAISSIGIDKAIKQVEQVLIPLSETSTVVNLVCGDARNTKLDNESVGFVLTSPPYINVFNYHQNYRLAVEALGWGVLDRARSEIGSNRKHRANRLYTVIQYSIDMALFLNELERVMLKGGKCILVVGRESNVRGMSFQNAEIFRQLIKEIPSLELKKEFTRKFTSRFGPVVYEEILILEKISSPNKINSLKLLMSARTIGKKQLEGHLSNQEDGEKLKDLQDAIAKCDSIDASPMGENY